MSSITLVTSLAALLQGCSARGPDVIYLPSASDVVTRMLEVARVGPDDVVRPGAWIVAHNFPMGDWRPDTVVRVTWPAGTTSTVQAWQLPADVAGTWEVVIIGAGGERRFRLRLAQQYQQVGGTASEGGRSLMLEGARLAGDSLELQLSSGSGDRAERLRFAGRVTGAEMAGSVRSDPNPAGARWRAIRT